jgi:hypothetical protein
LHTISGARPGGNRSAAITSTRSVQPESCQVLCGAGQRARVLIGGDNMCDSALRQYRRQHAGSGADVEGQRRSRRQRRLGHQIDILATHRREHAVMRMDARAERRHIDALSCAIRGRRSRPAVRAARRRKVRPQVRRPRSRPVAHRAPGAAESGSRPRTAAATCPACGRAATAPADTDGKPRQEPLPPAATCAACARCAGPRPAAKARILEVAAPEQGRALARQAIRLVRADAVIGDDDPFRRRGAGLRLPAQRTRRAVFGPGNGRQALMTPCRQTG